MMTEHQPATYLAYSDISLYSSSTQFVLQDASGAAIEINKTNNNISVFTETYSRPSNVRFVEKVVGILGIIRLLSGPYLIVMTKSVVLGSIRGHDIYRLTEARLLPFNEQLTLTPEQAEDEQQYKRLLNRVVAARSFYFSYSLDLTTSLQKRFTDQREVRDQSLWKLADELFFWNNYMVRDLVTENAEGWIIPVVRGFIEIQRERMGETLFDFALVSRQSCKRAGTRYNMRGADEQGNVANFVETEQIIEVHGETLSILQVRGSIPLFWTQYANLKYKPRPSLVSSKDMEPSFRDHFQRLLDRYQKVTAVSLVNQTGSEGVLAKAYEKHINEVLSDDPVRLVAFDFHKECKNMQYQNLNILIDDIGDDINQFGYLRIAANDKVIREQNGVIRNNCIDCLDRTNVVQSLIAQHVLQQQFADLNIPFVHSPSFESVFKNTWADNADALSMLYSGTGALKTDYTRTGKRTWRGLMNDGWNSATRYYLNNFRDGSYQDALNLFLGVYQVDPKAASPFKIARTEKKISTAVSFTIAFGVLMLLANILLMNPDDLSQRVLFAALWMGFLLFAFKVILFYGSDFVDKPVLTPGPKKIV